MRISSEKNEFVENAVLFILLNAAFFRNFLRPICVKQWFHIEIKRKLQREIK